MTDKTPLGKAFRQPNRLDLMSPAEKAITEAMYRVEESGASENLTNAVIALGKARDLVYEHFRTVGLKNEEDNEIKTYDGDELT